MKGTRGPPTRSTQLHPARRCRLTMPWTVDGIVSSFRGVRGVCSARDQQGAARYFDSFAMLALFALLAVLATRRVVPTDLTRSRCSRCLLCSRSGRGSSQAGLEKGGFFAGGGGGGGWECPAVVSALYGAHMGVWAVSEVLVRVRALWQANLAGFGLVAGILPADTG